MKLPLSKLIPATAGCLASICFGVINLVGQDEAPPAPESGEPANIAEGTGGEATPDEGTDPAPTDPPAPPVRPGGEKPDGEVAVEEEGNPPVRPGEAPPGGARPGFPPGGGGRPGFGAGGGRPPEGGEGFVISGDSVTLQFPNNPVTDMLGIYERLTNKTIIKDSAIFEGANISLVTPTEVTRDEAVRLIESSLLLNGYALISLPDGKSIKIMPTRGQGGGGQPEFSAGLKMYRSPDELPLGETIVTYFMKLDNLDPTEAGEIFSNHVGMNVYGRVTPITSPPGLLITENASIVRQLVNIQAVIDVEDQGSSIVTEFIEMEYADATTVAQILQASIDAAYEAESGVVASRPQAPRNGGGDGGGGDRERRGDGGGNNNGNQQNGGGGEDKNQAIPDPPAQLIADDRLNRIMVVATPDDFAYLRILIREFDQPIQVKNPLERQLNYAYAMDLLPVLADILQDTGTGNSTTAGGGVINSRTDPQSSSSVTSLTGRSGADRTPTIASTDTGGRSDQLTQPEEDTAPVSVLVGKTRIIADPQSNSVIAIGPREDLEKIDMLIDRLDRKPPQVYLATVIGKLQLGDDFQLGVDYLQKFNNFSSANPGAGGLAGSLLTGRTDVVDSGAIADVRDSIITTPFGPASALNIYGQIGESLDAFITALESSDRFKILSRPSVYALNNKKAVITSGQRIPVPATTLTNADTANNNGNVTTTIEYEDVVLKLEVVPLINANGEVTLTIAQINDTVTGQQIVGNNQVPIIGTEELATTVTIQDRTTVVLGGLITEQETESVSGIPVLSKIPILGAPFRNKTTQTVRSELVIFIQPIIVHDNEEMLAASYQEDLRTTVGAEAYERFPDSSHPSLNPEMNIYPAEIVGPDEPVAPNNRFLRHPMAVPNR